MATKIDTVSARERLTPRREPYWHRISKGCYLGFRRMTKGSAGNWVARALDPTTGKQTYKALGEFDSASAHERFELARKEAVKWFEHLGRGGSATPSSVMKACEDYVKHVRDTRGDDAADDLEGRFNRWVYGSTVLASIELDKLTKAKVEAWRKSLAKTPAKVSRDDRAEPVTRPRAASTVNRDMSALRAALNYAHDAGHVTTDMAWRTALRPSGNADGRRDAYLSREQRAELIRCADADLAQFLKGLALLPLRPGALAKLNTGHFDKARSVLTIGADKAGKDRRIKLPTQTAAFLAAAQKDKLPSAPLFARADGKRWDKDAWKKPVKDAVLAAGLPSAITAYALRHSAITDLVTEGLDLLTVARLSGTSVAMIEKHYGHLRAEHAAAGLAKLVL